MINSVVKAVKIMNLFTSAEPRLSLAEISSRLEMPKSTTHNLLNTLLSQGFIEKADDDTYALGTAIIQLSQCVRVNVELRDRVAPLLRKLADSCHESAYLTVLETDHALYIYAIESSTRLLARSAVGDVVPLHCTSVGKAMLALLPHPTVVEIIQSVGLPSFTEHTLSTQDDLVRDLEQIRSRGYSTDNQEHELGTYCIGAPILNSHGQVVGACSISGTDPAIVGTKVGALSERVMLTAGEASRRMGYVPARMSQLNRIPSTR
jgi:DNA-binding IclR family transcriptional regulator